MHLPWIATIDALIADLRANRDYENLPDAAFTLKSDDVQVHLRKAICDLERLRSDLNLIALRLRRVKPMKRMSNFDDQRLEVIENSLIRYPEQEGREGLARFVEQGALIGPTFGAYLAAVIRGELKLKSGTQSSFEDGRERRYAVKHVMTVQHLYAVSVTAAIRAYAAKAYPDDPNARREERIQKWIQRLQAQARSELSNPDLPEDRIHHWQGYLNGIRTDLPRGFLRDRTYPDGMDSLPPRPR